MSEDKKEPKPIEPAKKEPKKVQVKQTPQPSKPRLGVRR